MDILQRFGDFSGATFDSREVKPGMLFVALKGEKSDGHDYIPQALAKGAAGMVDGYDELDALALAYRRSLKAKVIGVTGSAGKTTTKELLRAFLSTVGRTHATAGNFNNHIGLPLTILNTPKDTEFLVLEMGTNHPGEIAHLCDVAEPDAGLVVSIGTAHIEFFKTREGIAKEKRTLLERAKEFRLEDAPVAEFLREKLAAILPGEHNLMNASKAFAMAAHYGCTEAGALAALENFSLPGQRWKLVEKDGVTYVNDAYNANPTSMIAALDTFVKMQCKGRRFAVLGDMFELGESAEELHRMVGRRVSELVDSGELYQLVAVGRQATDWIAGELPPILRVHVDTAIEAKPFLAANLKPGDLVLVKASHGMALDAVI